MCLFIVYCVKEFETVFHGLISVRVLFIPPKAPNNKNNISFFTEVSFLLDSLIDIHPTIELSRFYTIFDVEKVSQSIICLQQPNRVSQDVAIFSFNICVTVIF